MQFPIAVEQFLQYIRSEKRYSEHTCEAYHRDLQQFFTFLDKETYPSAVTDIPKDAVRHWLVFLRSEQFESKTLLRKLSTLKSFFRFLRAQGIRTDNPLTGIIAPKTPKPLPVFLPERHTDRLFSAWPVPVNHEQHTRLLILEILYQTGMRRAELIQLRLDSIRVEEGRIKVLGKGNKERLIPVQAALIQQILAYLPGREALNPTHTFLLVLKNGGALYPRYVYRVVHEALQRYTNAAKKSPHVLRHTFATQLLNQGAPVNAVKELLGHASLASTQLYTHTTIAQLKEVHRKAHPKA